MISFEYATNQVWAIKEDYLRLILEITSRTNPTIQEIEASLGTKLENRSKPASDSDGVRVIPIVGPIIRYASMFSDISGATSLSTIKNNFQSALNDDSVSSILLNIDSPGGEANGINEFAELVYNSRGTKPIVSYVSNMACSAAYWIASASDEIICDETATLGSIGCAAVIRDTDEKDAKEGIQNVEFVSSNSPNKRPDIKTDEGKALIQEQIDTIGDIFISKVARNRSTKDGTLTSKDVIKNFNKGGVLIGKDAVKSGLADSLGSLDSVLEKLKSGDSTSLIDNKETSMKVENENKKVEETETKVVSEASEVQDEVDSKEPFKTIKAKVGVLTPNIDSKEFENLKASNEQLLNEVRAMKEANAKLEQDSLKIKAESFVASLGEKLVPSQKENVIKQYITAVNDDKSNPVEGYSRMEALTKFWNEMPSHNLEEELLEDNETLENVTDSDDDESKLFAELDAQATAFAAFLNGKKASK